MKNISELLALNAGIDLKSLVEEHGGDTARLCEVIVVAADVFTAVAGEPLHAHPVWDGRAAVEHFYRALRHNWTSDRPALGVMARDAVVAGFDAGSSRLAAAARQVVAAYGTPDCTKDVFESLLVELGQPLQWPTSR